MKISMWMLYDALAAQCLRHNLDDRAKKRRIKSVMPYEGPQGLTGDRLYVADAAGPDAVVIPPAPGFIIFVGENFVLESPGACQYIVLEAAGYKAGLAAVCRAFDTYRDWYDTLQDELNGGLNLSRLCRLGSDMLGNFTMLYDREYNIIAGEFALDDAHSRLLIEKSGPFYALSADAVRQLKSNADFQQTFRQTGADVCIVDFLPYAVLYVNLGQGSVYEGRLCVTDTRRPFKNGDYQIAEILTEVLRVAIKRQAVRGSDESRRFGAFLQKVLDGHVHSDEQLETALQLWHWKRFGRYVCLYIQQSEQDAQTSSDLFLISKITLSLPGSCSVRYKAGIACVVSLPARETARAAAARLEHFLKGFIPGVGISDVYTDFMDTAAYHSQAVIAAEMGAEDSAARWCRHFRDYAMAHYFRYGTSVLPAIHYCDEDVRRLMAYQDTRTDYYGTLKAYLENNMNLLETSKALFIHRTTLFNRISKIREMISADLNSPEDRTRLLISFKLMEADKAYRRPQREKGRGTA
ncbi:PucR C-terminal helix-turn-helix domain-containing protein [Sporobacter termitidis DSM 10068]|uniref:PucR C-terminal helix-turn-helix domain-containing protein n=1 Tax=Sporobacter termitidis DSM 10068 TaxID=1123282 RepID=A0A1M5YGS9_9FIRM|nr:PucR family transcriptional regulator [Sporobacter termitidis]SHI11172.1 PucR C-terminal helix-turn-helix domain-containing protein [Sporobacter termitidis DSM 10068]